MTASLMSESSMKLSLEFEVAGSEMFEAANLTHSLEKACRSVVPCAQCGLIILQRFKFVVCLLWLHWGSSFAVTVSAVSHAPGCSWRLGIAEQVATEGVDFGTCSRWGLDRRFSRNVLHAIVCFAFATRLQIMLATVSLSLFFAWLVRSTHIPTVFEKFIFFHFFSKHFKHFIYHSQFVHFLLNKRIFPQQQHFAMGSLAQISSGAIRCSFNRFGARFWTVQKVPAQILRLGSWKVLVWGSGGLRGIVNWMDFLRLLGWFKSLFFWALQWNPLVPNCWKYRILSFDMPAAMK